MRKASIIEIKEFFGCPGRPVTPIEMRQFWGELSEEQKDYYKEKVGETLQS